MKRLFELLDQHWPLFLPRAHLRSEIGDDALAWLERERIAQRLPMEVGQSLPCPHACRLACQRRLVEHGGLVALCTASPVACADERIADGDAVWMRVAPAGMVQALQRALGLEVGPVSIPEGEPIALGVRRLGRRLAEFVLVPQRGAIARVLGRADPDRVTVVVTFGATAAIAGRALVVALGAAWDPLVEPRIDLGEEPVDAASAAALTRYDFAVDEATGRIWFAGRSLDLDQRPTERRLLLALLRQAGAWVPRDELLAELWPGDVGRRGVDPARLGARLRKVKSRVLERLGDPARIQSHAGPDEADCGLRLDVDPARVWWSGPRHARVTA